MPAKEIDWNLKFQWCVLNDAAIKRGIELGIAAAAKVVANIDFCAEAILDLDPEDIIKEIKND